MSDKATKRPCILLSWIKINDDSPYCKARIEGTDISEVGGTSWAAAGSLVYKHSDLFGISIEWTKEKEASAMPIVAAPPAFDALVEALRAVESEEVLFAWANEKGIGKPEYDRRSKIISDIRAAIAKVQPLPAGEQGEEKGNE